MLKRDKSADGTFVFAVRTTGIYCRPSCPGRRPKIENVVFFKNAEAARRRGYRACLRCHPDQPNGDGRQIKLIERVCRFIEREEESSSLTDLSKQFGLSPYHLQRTFKRVVGISPRQYADELRLKRLKGSLKKGGKVTTALYDSGYGSSSTLYGQAAKRLGMTPVNYKSGAQATTISYSTVNCPLGWLLIAKTERGVCALSLGDSASELIDWLKEEFPGATFNKDTEELAAYSNTILSYLRGEQPHCDLPLDVRATAFQRIVWEALRHIPYGIVRTYSEIAEAIGQPEAVRAVARACATNPVSLVVPCHRVVRKSGNLAGYRWGIKRKEALLNLEKQNKTKGK